MTTIKFARADLLRTTARGLRRRPPLERHRGSSQCGGDLAHHPARPHPVEEIDRVNMSVVTQPGVVYGTPSYMAPEVLEGRALDARSDLFVFGIVLYEMLAGQPPFRGDSAFEVARAIMQDEPQ